MPVLGKRNTAQYLYPPARKIKESMNKILSQNTDCMLRAAARRPTRRAQSREDVGVREAPPCKVRLKPVSSVN
jgi:hypothetical protein